MVAIVTGAGLGLARGSSLLLGAQGQLGSALLGQTGNRVTVNAANGNLVIQSQDELLIGRGLDDVITNSYNSQDTTGGWQKNFQRHVDGLTGTVNTAGSTVTRTLGDDSTIVYTFDTTKNLYVGNEAGGAYDTLAFDGTNNTWKWTEGKSRATELYDNANGGRLVAAADADGNVLSYTYTGSQLTKITTTNGDYTSLVYTGTLLTSVVTSYTNASGLQSLTRVRYGYDTSSRLTTVTVDLSPEDNSISDGKTFVTTYGYDGTSSRITSITESDGTSLQIAYTLVGSAYAVSTLTQTISSGVTTATTFSYVAGSTTVTDSQGAATTLTYDSKGRLTRLKTPSTTTGAVPQSQFFTYDANDNLIYSGPASDPMFSNLTGNWNDLSVSASGVTTTTQTVETAGGVQVYRRTTTTTPPSGWFLRNAQSLNGEPPVVPGQTVNASVYVASTGASLVRLYILFRDSSGVGIGVFAVNMAAGGTIDANGVSGAVFGQLSAVAPEGAVYAQLMVQTYADGTAPLDVKIAQPMVTVDGSAPAPAYRYTYDSNGNRLSQTDVYGAQTTYTYDTNNQLLTSTFYTDDGAPLTTRYVYDGESHLTYVIDPLGIVTRYVYNTIGQQTSTIHFTAGADVYTTAGTPTDATMLAWATSASRSQATTQRTDMTYDARGNLLTSTTYGGTTTAGAGVTTTARITNYVYDQAGQLLQRILSTPTMTDLTVLPKEVYVYDGLGRVISVSDFSGQTTTTVYSNTSTGSQAVVTLANGTTQTSIYDKAGELVTYTVAGGGLTAITSYVYDSNGNLIQKTDPTGLGTYYVYNDLNQKVGEIEADGTLTAYAYNAQGQVIATTIYDAKLSAAQVTTLDAARASNASVELSAILPVTSTDDRWSWNIYDVDGRLVQTVDGLGYVTGYVYSDAGWLIRTTAYATALSATVIAAAKTGLPGIALPVTANTANDRVTRYFYDADGRKVAVLDGEGYLTQTVYDGAGQVTHTIAFATMANASLWATGSLAQLLTSVGTSAPDIHNWFTYNNDGTAHITVNGEGYATRYDRTYTATGYSDRVLRFADQAQVDNTTPITGTLNITASTEQIVLAYDLDGRLLTKTLTLASGVSEVTTYAYDNVGQLISETTASATTATGTADPRTSTVRYDGLGRKIGTLDGVGTAALAALGASPTQAQIDAVWSNYGTTYKYDTAGRLISQTDPVGAKSRFFYDINGRLAYQIDSAAGVVKYSYNSFDEQIGVTVYTGKIPAATLAPLTGGQIVTALTDAIAALANAANDSVTQLYYGADGRVTKKTEWVSSTASQSTTYAYNGFGEVTSVVAPFNTSGATVQTTSTYSRRGQLLTSTADAAGLALKTIYAYDAFGHVKSVTDASGTVRTTTYDRVGNVKTQVDGNAKTASYSYDGLGHVLTSTDRNNQVTTYTYTPFDRQMTVTDPNGIVMTTTTNAYGQTVKIVDGNGTATTFAYDADGNLTSSTDGLGNVTTRTYSDADQLLTVVSPRTSITRYTYDSAGRMLTRSVDDATTGLKLKTTWAYDGKGQVLTVTDPSNVVTTYTYDLLGRELTEVVDSGGLNLTSTWVYNGEQLLTKTVNGVATQYTYDAVGRLIKEIVDPGTGHQNLTTQYAYDSDGNLITVTDAAGKITRNIYDNDNRLAFVIDPTGAVTANVIDNENHLTKTTEYVALYTATGMPNLTDMKAWATANGNAAVDRVTWLIYDVGGRLTQTRVDYGTTGHLNLTTVYTYDNDGNVTSVTDRAGRITRYAYDADNRVAFTIDPTGAVTGNTYDADGNITQTVHYAATFATTGVQTQAQMQTWVTANASAANDRVTRAAYDGAERQIYSIDAYGMVTGFTYDNDGNVTQTVAYAVRNTTTGVQSGSTLATWVAANANATNDRTTQYVYDNAGRLSSSVDPRGVVTAIVYNAYGKKQTITVANGTADAVTTAYSYDTAGRLYQMVTAYGTTDAATTKSTFDGMGRVLTSTDGNGKVTTYTYDGDGRLLTTTDPTGAVTTNVYNTFGNLVQITDPNGNDGYFYYDGAGRRTLAIDSLGYATATSYSKDGEILQVARYGTAVSLTGITTTTAPTVTVNAAVDNTTTFTYDNDGRVLTSTDAMGKKTTNVYNAFGDLTQVTNALGAAVTYTYDARGLMLTQVTPASTVTDGTNAIAPASTTAYEYDIFGNRTKMIEGQGSALPRTTTYVYDKNGNVTQQKGDAVTVTTITGATSSVTPTQTFTYDRRGNQITATDANGAKTVTYYDFQNRKMAQVDALGYLTQWTYDDAGNVLTQKAYSDALTLPVSTTTTPAPVNTANVRETDYTYDAVNRLKTTKVLNVTTSNWNGTAWVNTTGTLTSTIVYDLNGNITQQTDNNGKSVYSYYDALGRMTAQIDQLGFVTKYEYDTEGNVTKQTQFATVMAGPFSVSTPPTSTQPATNTADRITTFTYDHNGNRLTEARANLSYATVNAGNLATPVTSTTGTATITFTYNAQNQVLTKTEANGDVTSYIYDSVGRVAAMTTASGLTTLTTYDALGNVLRTVAGPYTVSTTAGITSVVNTGPTEGTIYTYGAGGRVATKKDPAGFILTYGYDASGRVTIESYGRLKSDGTTVQEANQTTYDALGQVITTGKATWSGTAWVTGDTKTDAFYNGYGEVVARGTNSGRDIAKAQGFADYDSAGRVWRSNMDGGIVRVYGYDGNGNLTLQIQSLGATNLNAVANLTAAIAATGTTKTYNFFDARNQLTQVERPTSTNLEGTVSSGGNLAVGPAGYVTVTQHNVGGGADADTISSFQVTLSNSTMTTDNGTGAIHVDVTSNTNGDDESASGTRTSGSTNCGTYYLYWKQPQSMGGPPPQPYVTVRVWQLGPNGQQITLGSQSFYVSYSDNTVGTYDITQSNGTGSSLQVQNLDPATTAVKMYVRATGATGGYTLVNTTKGLDANGNPIDGTFIADPYLAPFNGTAGSSWEVKYIATDASGKVTDAKGGTVTFDSTGKPTVTSLTAVPVFSAALNSGTYTLTNTPVTIGHSDSTQTFNAFGDILTQVDANGNTTTFKYDVEGHLVQKIAPQVTVVGENGVATTAAPTDTYYYDKSGRQVGHKDANGNITTQVLLAGSGYGGEDGLATAIYNPDGGSIVDTYDIFGNLTTQTDAAGAVTTYTYDKDNRVATVAHATRTSTTYTSGSLTQLIDTYVYDGLGQRIKHTNNVFGTSVAETTDYDLQGRVIETESFAGQSVVYAFAWTAATAGEVTAGQTTGGAWTRTTTMAGKTSTDKTDTFGTALQGTDFGGHVTTYTYNLIGQVTDQTSTAGQDLNYTYTSAGYLASVTDTVSGMKSVYAYDKNGNRTVEAYYKSGASPVYYQTATVTYDALNRITRFMDAEADITYAYDAASNRREIKTVYPALGQISQTEDYWYKYDKMNRLTLEKGSLVSGAITASATTITLSYNARGDRISATYGRDNHVEDYTYSADGYLETVSLRSAPGGTSTLRVTRKNDMLGRTTAYNEYQATGASLLTRTMSYDGDNRVVNETDTTTAVVNGVTQVTSSVIHNDYKLLSGSTYTGTDIGVVTHTSNVQTQTGSSSTTTNTTFNYVWWGSAKSYTTTIAGVTTGTATYTYDANGFLVNFNDTAVSRTIGYQNDAMGQVVTRQEYNSGVAGARRSFFYLNGQMVGDRGTDQLASQIDYAQQLVTDNNNAVYGLQPWYSTPATNVVGLNGDYDNYAAYNSTSIDQTGSNYTVNAGDTLETIAGIVWGDTSLWYLLAEANGLGAGQTLVVGQVLSIPSQVISNQNNATTFKPYNPTDALGNTNPSQPKPPVAANKKSGCGTIGQILTVIIAVVVTAIVAPWATTQVTGMMGSTVTAAEAAVAATAGGVVGGAAGSIASQGFAIATGNQDKFSWSAVATSAIAGGVGGGFKNVQFANNAIIDGAARLLTTNAVSQGINMAVGLQKKFDWTGLAVSGVVGGVVGGLQGTKWYGGLSDVDKGIVTGTASVLTGAATRSLLTGQDFGKSLKEALPDAIGQTVGSMIAGAIANDVTKKGTSSPTQTDANSDANSHLAWNKALGIAEFEPGVEVAGDAYLPSGGHFHWDDEAVTGNYVPWTYTDADNNSIQGSFSSRVDSWNLGVNEEGITYSAPDVPNATALELGIVQWSETETTALAALSFRDTLAAQSSTSSIFSVRAGDSDAFTSYGTLNSAGFDDYSINAAFASGPQLSSIKFSSVLHPDYQKIFSQPYSGNYTYKDSDGVLREYGTDSTGYSYDRPITYAQDYNSPALVKSRFLQNEMQSLQNGSVSNIAFNYSAMLGASESGRELAMNLGGAVDLMSVGVVVGGGNRNIGRLNVSERPVATGGKIPNAISNSAAERISARHLAWSSDLGAINDTTVALGQRALRNSGGDWVKSEELFNRYLSLADARLARTGSSYAVELQPAAIAGGDRVPNFVWLHRGDATSPLIMGSDGTLKLFAFPGSRRLDAGIIDMTVTPNQNGLRPLVSGYDITLSPTKPPVGSYYREYFGDIPIADIRPKAGN